MTNEEFWAWVEECEADQAEADWLEQVSLADGRPLGGLRPYPARKDGLTKS